MKTAILAILCVFSAFAWAEEPPIRYDIWHLVEGYRLGFISDFGQQSITELWRYEGSLNLGTSTAEGPIFDRRCTERFSAAASEVGNQQQHDALIRKSRQKCFLTEEPWPFTVLSEDVAKKVRQTGVSPVLIHYEEPIWNIYEYFTKTEDYAVDILPIDPTLKIEKSHTLNRSLYLGDLTNREHHTMRGRIIKAALEHPLRKTYEVIVEEGLTGDSFIGMSVDDTKMFEYIVQAMLTGKVLKIGYVLFWDWEGFLPSEIFNYNTYYRITSVQVTDVDFPVGIPKK